MWLHRVFAYQWYRVVSQYDLLLCLWTTLHGVAESLANGRDRTTIIGRRCELLSETACTPVSGASMYMILDTSIGWLCAFDYVGRHAFATITLSICLSMTLRGLLRRLGDACCCSLRCSYMLKCSGIAYCDCDYIMIVYVSAQSTYEWFPRR